MKRIAVLSGKGGVGKSSITASLALALAERGKKLLTLDCDVEASNLSLVLGVKKTDRILPIKTNLVAEVDPEKCISCKKCYKTCYFDAIAWRDNSPHIDGMACEGCTACELVCPRKAISMTEVENAKIAVSSSEYGFRLVSGQLGIAESGSGKVVYEVKKIADQEVQDEEIMLIDASAGIGCPVIASVSGTDFVIAVTEPSPSAFADLKRALLLVDHFNIGCAIIINKYDLNEKQAQKIERFARKFRIPVIAKINYDRKFVDALVNMKPVYELDKNMKKKFIEISDKLIELKVI